MKLKIGLMKGGVCVHVCVQNNYAGVGFGERLGVRFCI